jgi:hypothetical protein
MRLDICGVKASIPRIGSPFKKQFAERIGLTICLLFVFSVLLFGYRTIPVQAASPITSSGLNTQVSPPSTLPSGKVQYDITGGARPGGGTNLFHSFGDFNVPHNNIANFLNDSGFATYPRSRHRREHLQQLWDDPNHRIRERQSVRDESRWILVRAERYGERRWDGVTQTFAADWTAGCIS